MKKGLKGCLVLGLMVMALSFSGCTLHVTKQISDKLDQEAMYKMGWSGFLGQETGLHKCEDALG